MQALPPSHRVLLGATAATWALDGVLVVTALLVWLVRGHQRTWGAGAVFLGALGTLGARSFYVAVVWRGTRAHRAGRGTLTDPRWHRSLELWPMVSVQLCSVIAVGLVGSTLLETPNGREPWAVVFWRQTSGAQRALLAALAATWVLQLAASWYQVWHHHGGARPGGVMVREVAAGTFAPGRRGVTTAQQAVYTPHRTQSKHLSARLVGKPAVSLIQNSDAPRPLLAPSTVDVMEAAELEARDGNATTATTAV